MRTVALGNFVEIKGGGTPDKQIPAYWGGSIPWASVKDFKSTELSKTEDFITELGVQKSATNIIPAGAIIVPTRMAVGKAAINTIDMAINQDLKAIFPKSGVDSRYLLHALLSQSSQLERQATGATVKGIKLEALRTLKILLPTLKEQKRIASILDQADSLRIQRQRALNYLNKFGQAIFYEMFGDPVTNPKNWPLKKATELSKRITVGIVVKPASYYVDKGVPAIRGTNIKPFGIDLSDVVYFSKDDNEGRLAKTRVWLDDLVIVRSGRPGQTAVITAEHNGINCIDALILTPDKKQILPHFFAALLNSEEGKRIVLSESRGQVQQHFNVGSLSEAEFYVPPMALQTEYDEKMLKVRQHITVAEKALSSMCELFLSLQHRAFRGEL